MISRKSRLTAALVAFGIGAGASVALAPAASAMGCNVAHRDIDGMIAVTARVDSPVRVGPGEGCAIAFRTSPRVGQPFFKDCWVKNDAGNIWWYGQTVGSAGNLRYGWIWDGNLVGTAQVEARYRCF